MNMINYPPEKILNPPTIGKKNYEHIILWMLFNNDECTWSIFTEDPLSFSTSTLSKYFKLLKSEGYVSNYSRGHYKITTKGQHRYHEISSNKDKKRKLNYPPDIIRKKRKYDHWILWMVYNNTFCKWSDFLEEPLSINQSSLSKKIKILLNNQYIIKENKEYRISHKGKLEYAKMLKNYDLDRQSILNEESNRVEDITAKTIKFFEVYQIRDEDIQFRFLTNSLRFDYDRVKSMLTNRLDFDKILLFLSIKHPDQYPDNISTEEFCARYGISLSKLEYYIDEIVDNNLYDIKFFKLKSHPNAKYYFQENETLEIMLRAITEKYIKKFTYFNRLFLRPIDGRMIQEHILDDTCGKIIKEDLKEALRLFLPEYIQYLAYKVEKKVELKDTYDKLDAIIWQNMMDIIQTTDPEDLEYKFLGQCEQNFQLDLSILKILKSYYRTDSEPNVKAIEDLIDKKEFNKALELVDNALKSDENNKISFMLRGYILCYLNRYKDLHDYISDLFRANENFESDIIFLALYFLLVFSNMSIGDFRNAKEASDRIMKLYPNHPLSYVIKALVLGYNQIYKFDLGQFQLNNGLNDLDVAIDLESNDLNKSYYYQLKSRILLGMNNFEDAIEMIDKAIILNSKDVDLYHSKSAILMYYNRYEVLLTFLEIIYDLFPEMENDITMKKASIYRQLGDFESAFTTIDELLDKDPKNSSALNYKAYLYQYLDKKKEAIELIEDLIKKEPNNGIYFDSYGEILMYYEEYEKAVNKFQKAIELSNFGWFLYQMYIKLGICYKELGNKELAIENLKKGKEYTYKCFCDYETKKKWLTIADLFITETESYA